MVNCLAPWANTACIIQFHGVHCATSQCLLTPTTGFIWIFAPSRFALENTPIITATTLDLFGKLRGEHIGRRVSGWKTCPIGSK